MSNPPEWILEARSHWTYNGSVRPSFAIEPGPGQESVWDYPRPPKIVVDSRKVRVQYRGLQIAATDSAVRVTETAGAPTFYIPPDDVRLDVLEPAQGKSLCEWKGEAVYWSLASGSLRAQQIAWTYPDPFPDFDLIAGWFAFYAGRVDCFVGPERAEPQPGGLYGGWVTSELVGPIKGEPGSEGW